MCLWWGRQSAGKSFLITFFAEPLMTSQKIWNVRHCEQPTASFASCYPWKEPLEVDKLGEMRAGSRGRSSTGVKYPHASMVPGPFGYHIGDVHEHDPV